MAAQVLEKKLRTLEERVTRLEELPHRMHDLGSQILQLRTDMADEFSVVRGEIGSIDDARRETRVLFEEYVGRLAVVDERKSAQGRTRKPKGTRTPR